MEREINQTAYNWLLEKFNIKKGSTYVGPKITLRQCASFIDEYLKTTRKEK